ncbi:hypothetical protein DFH05DRAFT_1397429, partial [Lentinula detonsa]
TVLPYSGNASAHPLWFQQAFTYLNVDLGEQYLSLLSSWIDKERIGAYENPKTGLEKKNRPATLSEWQKKRFVKSKDPNISDDNFIVSFSGEVWCWWVSLQPVWRAIAPGTKPSHPPVIKTSMTNWKSLDKKGLNGWFGILVCLKWWGMGLEHCPVEKREELKEDWLRAIDDVSAMLNGLLTYYRASPK